MENVKRAVLFRLAIVLICKLTRIWNEAEWVSNANEYIAYVAGTKVKDSLNNGSEAAEALVVLEARQGNARTAGFNLLFILQGTMQRCFNHFSRECQAMTILIKVDESTTVTSAL